MAIQWFPGHMAKARRQVTEKLKLIDVVIELVDARVPQSSRNPMVDEITAGKPRLIVLNKADMADQAVTDAWMRALKRDDIEVVAVDAKHSKGLKQLMTGAEKLMQDKHDRMREKGRNPGPIRALIIGIPNVGKSTLINRLAGRNIAITGDRPGVTKRQQWIKMKGGEMELLDTPGILWPKFEDQMVGYRLAATGAIKDDILNLDDIAMYAARELRARYPEQLKERFKLDDLPEDAVELLELIGKKRGLLSGGYVDFEKASELLLNELRHEKIGRVSLETPADHNMA
ncbi:MULTISPECIES: ribosome biogenesis GTPase YlqF [unclassified Exiguobacterium]|uniref:ribosome biogenesis GTPase YlqF n=1 Tax=unclassified Exiguobacterium TaxID=2644629 RepID=UPI00103E4394|nr:MULTISPECIES: ribosome biogenesis GTPase YlqF [unclassified Exiguobacterium]TCI37368.1 ribosome biogenesis GTPase YlqF [Exiguobacterium sp. SH4S7]TCI45499.1 ribosome biogenesis GTPase YlqF [Exiguobacterium sp. SH5S32]TCI52700.1 ribosome biogenesis GTPase YlqF [Exiguobacterium sp. SH1S4]TCI55850.1 ribosome biogenesis GTPase YlqF [Exiguobacterium sp. SH1S21]TCI65471.1 ribosome biogenesis GTPase YlqF [Exiguobacterium sp. SH0S2]